jgi:hypothetical protein
VLRRHVQRPDQERSDAVRRQGRLTPAHR